MPSTASALTPAPVAHQRPQLRLVPPPRPRSHFRARALVAYSLGLTVGLLVVAGANLVSSAEGASLYGLLAAATAATAAGALVRTRGYARNAGEIRS